MQARQWFVLAGLLLGGATVSAVLPKMRLINEPEGPIVLGGMALLAASIGLILRLRTHAGDSVKSD